MCSQGARVTLGAVEIEPTSGTNPASEAEISTTKRPVSADLSNPRPSIRSRRAPFEKERGVTAISARGRHRYFVVPLAPDVPHADQEIRLYRAISACDVSINLVKLYPGGISFVVDAPESDESQAERAVAALTAAGFQPEATPAVAMVSLYALGMRGLCGVMAHLYGALLAAGVPVVQTGDGPDTIFCLVASGQAERAVQALRAEFGVGEPAPRILVQKFGGKSVGTANARRLAAERVRRAVNAGFRPVVVVSAIGRQGEPYATDTLLAELEAVAPGTDSDARERDLLMACGEIISTVIMTQTLSALGLRATALTGGQAGILTDDQYGDAQILSIDPEPISRLLDETDPDLRLDAVVVAGFQGVTADGAITTLGRGGSDTTASALGAALGAEMVEIYTHVDGVMTADPEVVPEARTLSMVTYEEVCNMAHQGARVIHPRAAEIAMGHGIPLWVKSSFVDAPGTLIAPLTELQPTQGRTVTGVALVPGLVQFTLTELGGANRQGREHQVYRALGDAHINLYLTSAGPTTSAFIVETPHADLTESILMDLGEPIARVEGCTMVSLVALNMWEEPGFLGRIAGALHAADVEILQMADSERSVSCLVHSTEAGAAARALHREFGLAE